MICGKCKNNVEMKYEKNDKGFLKGTYWCYSCNESCIPSADKPTEKEVEMSAVAHSAEAYKDMDMFDGYYDWMYD